MQTHSFSDNNIHKKQEGFEMFTLDMGDMRVFVMIKDLVDTSLKHRKNQEDMWPFGKKKEEGEGGGKWTCTRCNKAP